MRNSTIFRLAQCVVIFAALYASEPTASSQTNVSPQPIPIRTLFQPAEYGGLAMSPDGTHILASMRNESTWRLVVLSIEPLKIIAQWTMTEGDYVSSLRWKDDSQFIFTVDKLTGNLLNDLKFVVRTSWYAGNIDGTDPTQIMGRFDGVADLLPDDPERILVSYLTSTSNYLLRIPLRGKWPLNPKKLLTPLTRIEGLIFDSEGEPRYVWGERKLGGSGAYVRQGHTWKPYLLWDEGESERIPLALNEQRDRLYVSASDNGNTHRIDAIDLSSGAVTNLIPEMAVEPSALLLDRDTSEPIAAAYHDREMTYRFIDTSSRLAKAYAGLVGAFPNHSLSFEGYSRDKRFVLVRAYSDVDPGDYFLLDVEHGKARYLLSERSWIDPSQMASTRHISFPARDGLTISGYLTLPAGTAGERLPMVLLLHGGPHGVRDVWQFDPEVQLLASRGYAVLQVNFRGSGGFGSRFQMAGYGAWGSTMIDDMLDGVLWAITSGVADPQRICTFGASYGGFAALQAVAREPAMFRCAIGYVGVYSIPLMFDSGDTSESKSGREFLSKVMPKGSAERVAQSPAYATERIKVPVMLAHGGKDRRAPIAHFELMRDRLKQSGNPPEVEMVIEDEGHGFVDLDHQVEFYEALLAFLNKHTKPTTEKAD